MRVYHFLNDCYGLDDIAKRRIKVARVGELNDPFEFRAVDWGGSISRAHHQKTIDEFDSSHGLVCFSQNWRNPVQWSHYAAKHSGVCLGFEIPDDRLHRVKYSTNRIKPNLLEYIFHQQYEEDTLRTLLTTKFSHWRYERELRQFVRLENLQRENSFYFLPFSDSLALSEVIVGARSTVSREILNDKLGAIRAGVSCKKARLAFRTFQVVEQRKASLWE